MCCSRDSNYEDNSTILVSTVFPNINPMIHLPGGVPTQWDCALVYYVYEMRAVQNFAHRVGDRRHGVHVAGHRDAFPGALGRGHRELHRRRADGCGWRYANGRPAGRDPFLVLGRKTPWRRQVSGVLVVDLRVFLLGRKWAIHATFHAGTWGHNVYRDESTPQNPHRIFYPYSFFPCPISFCLLVCE